MCLQYVYVLGSEPLGATIHREMCVGRWMEKEHRPHMWGGNGEVLDVIVFIVLLTLYML